MGHIGILTALFRERIGENRNRDLMLSLPEPCEAARGMIRRTVPALAKYPNNSRDSYLASSPRSLTLSVRRVAIRCIRLAS